MNGAVRLGEVDFKGWRCVVRLSSYLHGGAKRLDLTDLANGGPVATATVNVTRVSERLLEDEVCVKDSSENEGMLDALTAAGIIEETGRRVKIGCVTVPVVKLLDGSGT